MTNKRQASYRRILFLPRAFLLGCYVSWSTITMTRLNRTPPVCLRQCQCFHVCVPGIVHLLLDPVSPLFSALLFPETTLSRPLCPLTSPSSRQWRGGGGSFLSALFLVWTLCLHLYLVLLGGVSSSVPLRS